ncbi:MAG: hypothetical protein ACYC9Y_09530 [Candidatus Methylomirabilia bacterium]
MSAQRSGTALVPGEIVERVRGSGWRSPLCVVFYGNAERDIDVEALLASYEHLPLGQALSAGRARNFLRPATTAPRLLDRRRGAGGAAREKP